MPPSWLAAVTRCELIFDLNGAMLAVGDTVQDFSATDHEGNSVSLDELLSTGPLVLYFYIKAKTPG